MSINIYEKFKLYVNRIKFNIEILIKKESEEINKLCEINIIKTKRDIEIYIKTLNNEQLIEFVEQLGYDIIYYQICSEDDSNKYIKKMNECLSKYLLNLQNFINDKILIKNIN